MFGKSPEEREQIPTHATGVTENPFGHIALIDGQRTITAFCTVFVEHAGHPIFACGLVGMWKMKVAQDLFQRGLLDQIIDSLGKLFLRRIHNPKKGNKRSGKW